LSGLNLQLDPTSLEDFVRRVVEQTIAALDAQRAQLDSGLAYTEAQAAALIGQQPYQLRDERQKGLIEASSGPARKILSTRASLLAYLAKRPWTP
jgi:hypothetical protein